ncbi:hypothetical protein VNO78_05520 [Psophocarpus tetragonolobus]|uniref:Uncharacterized protein n=1 Tax=Psophocarpus tetragonolobus TaxID=3891 RepID=A0AAN9SZP1_PSOTE
MEFGSYATFNLLCPVSGELNCKDRVGWGLSKMGVLGFKVTNCSPFLFTCIFLRDKQTKFDGKLVLFFLLLHFGFSDNWPRPIYLRQLEL